MTQDEILADDPRRPIWLITLADLMMLLVGFFAFLQASQGLDGAAIAKGMREGFGVESEAPMAVDTFVVSGFAPGSASVPLNDADLWARDAVADPRVIVRIVGGTDGTDRDVDPQSGSTAILAADRARAVAALLATQVQPDRLAIETRPGAGRAVQLNLAFAGEK